MKKVFGFVGNLLWELATLVVILIIFSSANTKFESIVFTLLVIIYLTIRSNAQVSWQDDVAKRKIDLTRFNFLRELMGDKNSEEEEKEVQSMLTTERAEIEHSKAKVSAGIIFVGIDYAIAVINLILSLSRAY